ncbi:hypothetical protein Q73_07105 [Bacillus coahuilensis m2-6]|nr:hypothetical protein Q73_07105 [Bacillus coahuilensis m2-6]
MTLGDLLFVTGGVRSGKTSYSEHLAYEFHQGCNGNLIYLATSSITDSEMFERISRHQKDRNNSALPWVTIEKERDLDEIFHLLNPQDVIVIDCLTTWLSNEMFSVSTVLNPKNKMIQTIKSILKKSEILIIVSNEISFEWIEPNSLTYSYCETLGELHTWIVLTCSKAIEMDIGIPIIHKEINFFTTRGG